MVLDSKQTAKSGIYYLGGKLRTLEEVKADNLPNESILRSNMEGNGYHTIIENTNSWKFTGPFQDEDTLLDFKFEDKK